MSHFTVMVINGKVDEQLAPYDENERLETPVVTGEVSNLPLVVPIEVLA